MALLKLEQRTETTAAFRIGRPPRAGESAVVFGFPLSQLLASTGNVTTGIVTALAGPLNDPHQIQISAPVQSGNSGGPVLDASGYLIGVVVSKLNAVRGDMPQNVNFAIKASTAANFLDAHGIAYQSATGEKNCQSQRSSSRREVSPFKCCVRARRRNDEDRDLRGHCTEQATEILTAA